MLPESLPINSVVILKQMPKLGLGRKYRALSHDREFYPVTGAADPVRIRGVALRNPPGPKKALR
jgi:hypothetical protein